jgi:hypothetical protein
MKTGVNMQCVNLSTSDFIDEEKNVGIHSKLTSNLSPPLRIEHDGSVLRQLLTASKDAEVLIASLFELNLIAAAPLLHIWDRFAIAIEEAQLALQAQDRKSVRRY